MCGRYYISEEMKSELLRLVKNLENRMNRVQFSGDIVPSVKAPVLVNQGGQVDADLYRWGYQTSFQKTLIINARAESAADKKLFAPSLHAGRCIIPAAGFYEWNHAKTKYTFTNPPHQVLFLAGLYRQEEDENHFVILTTGANASMKMVHDRMPLILDSEQMMDWLVDEQAAHSLLASDPPMLQRYTENEQMTLEFS